MDMDKRMENDTKLWLYGEFSMAWVYPYMIIGKSVCQIDIKMFVAIIQASTVPAAGLS